MFAIITGIKGNLTPFCACAAVWFLIRRNSFQSWYLWQKSFSIDLTRRLKIVITTLKDCLVIYERFKTAYFVFWVEYRRELSLSSRGGFQSSWRRKLLSPHCRLVSKEKMGGWTSETILIAADVHASQKKVKCLCLYSTDTAFTQHKHDKYSLQTKGQIPADKELFRKARETPSWLAVNSWRAW